MLGWGVWFLVLMFGWWSECLGRRGYDVMVMYEVGWFYIGGRDLVTWMMAMTGMNL